MLYWRQCYWKYILLFYSYFFAQFYIQMERNFTNWFNLQNSYGANFDPIDQNSKTLYRKNQESISLFQKFPIRDQQSRGIYQNIFNYQNTISFNNFAKHFAQKEQPRNTIPIVQTQQIQNISDPEESQLQSKFELKKGLKSLAKVLLKTLKKKKFSSSKEVAQNIQKLLLANVQNRHEFQKQSKNIRRRIYDALNVMMSVGLLERDFSLVRLINFDCEIQKSKLRISRKLQIETKLLELKDKIQCKRNVQERLRKKRDAIQFWYKKRQSNQSFKSQTFKCQQTEHCPRKDHIHFPIIFFRCNQAKTTFKLARNKQSFQICQYQQNIGAFGQIDMFEKIKDMQIQNGSQNQHPKNYQTYHESQSKSVNTGFVQKSSTKSECIQQDCFHGIQIIGKDSKRCNELNS